MYRWPPAPMIMFLSLRKGPLMWWHAGGVLAVGCASVSSASPAITAATEAARMTALVTSRASFIVSSPGAARRSPSQDTQTPHHDSRRDNRPKSPDPGPDHELCCWNQLMIAAPAPSSSPLFVQAQSDLITVGSARSADAASTPGVSVHAVRPMPLRAR